MLFEFLAFLGCFAGDEAELFADGNEERGGGCFEGGHGLCELGGVHAEADVIERLVIAVEDDAEAVAFGDLFPDVAGVAGELEVVGFVADVLRDLEADRWKGFQWLFAGDSGSQCQEQTAEEDTTRHN